MDCFNLLTKYLRLLGILQWEPTQRGSIITFSLKCIYVGVSGNFLISTTWFGTFEARKYSEYALVFISISYSILNLVWYFLLIRKSRDHTDQFANLDRMVEQSMFRVEFRCESQITNLIEKNNLI